jgi:hypothetical protein
VPSPPLPSDCDRGFWQEGGPGWDGVLPATLPASPHTQPPLTTCHTCPMPISNENGRPREREESNVCAFCQANAEPSDPPTTPHHTPDTTHHTPHTTHHTTPHHTTPHHTTPHAQSGPAHSHSRPPACQRSAPSQCGPSLGCPCRCPATVPRHNARVTGAVRRAPGRCGPSARVPSRSPPW